MKEFKGDLHIHTCLSPCGDSEMVPSAIVNEAKKNLDIIGISDHNSTENVDAVKKVARIEGLEVIGGVEITSAEEVHILGFFDNEGSLKTIQEIIYENLPGENNETIFGEQIVIDEYDRKIGVNKKLLIGATTLSVQKIVETIHSLGGLAIASHIDREAFSILGQLGFIPEGLALDALEISPLNSLESIRTKFPQIHNFPFVSFSDAHRLEEVGKSTTNFLIEEASIQEIKKALLNQDGRSILAHFRYS